MTQREIGGRVCVSRTVLYRRAADTRTLLTAMVVRCAPTVFC